MLSTQSPPASLPSDTGTSGDPTPRRALTRAEFHAKWSSQALQWRQDGITKRAIVVERMLADLDTVEWTESEALLNLVQAAAWSGFSADHIGRLVREGKIPNHGRKNAPLVRRGDLPRKPGHLPPAERSAIHDRERIVRAAVSKFVRK